MRCCHTLSLLSFAVTTAVPTKTDAETLLQILTGRADAAFRPGQWEAVSRLVVDRGRVLVVQRTGWGKSAVYFLATRLLRDQGAGPTLLISPLLALMRDQVKMAERAGVRAETINSANTDEWDAIETAVDDDKVDVLLVSPERLQNPRFQKDVLPRLVKRVGLLVVDEAHCISDWGHDFRPDYRRISRVLRILPGSVPVLCTTAPANNRVVDDITNQLGEHLEVQRGALERESLALSVVNMPEQSQRLAWLAQVIPTFQGSGIVYCLTIADAGRVAGWLRSQGITAAAYSGETDPEERIRVEERLLANEVKVVVATSALGMGFDKPDLAFVVHFQSPGSAVAYYQQVGRAGRALARAVGVLLPGREDVDIQNYFIDSAFPAQDKTEVVVGLLQDRAVPMSVYEIEEEVNIRHGRLEAMLKVLEVEGAVEKAGRGWQRTLQPWSYDAERVARVSATRKDEQAAMKEYATIDGCRMAFLRDQLDDPAEPCGRCDNCTGDGWTVEVDDSLAAAAARFLRHAEVPIAPRKRWPTGLNEPRGVIAAGVQLAEGRALGVLGDGGWGRVVQRYRGRGGEYPDELIEAAVDLVRGWAPDPAPEWVASVPSASQPQAVSGFAARLAAALELEFHDIVFRRRPGAPQREMENSLQQVHNVHGAFGVEPPVPTSPVLLVDDIVDSRWTITVVGIALRNAGSGVVHPFALARALSS